MNRRQLAALAFASFALAGNAAQAAAPTTWDDLVKVKSKRLDAVYLLPGADFHAYTKVMLDPTEVAFRKDWQRDYNSSSIGVSRRITDADVQVMLEEGRTIASDQFTKALTEGGYQVVTTAGPDVMRMRTAIINISISAPDTMTASRSRTFSREAGAATLVVEVRDSMTGAILGRAVDQRLMGENRMGARSSVSNRADFSQLVRSWGKMSVNGLDELKALGEQGQPKK